VDFFLKNKLLYGRRSPAYGDFDLGQSETFSFCCSLNGQLAIKEMRSCPQEFARMAAIPGQSPYFQSHVMNEERLVNIEAKITFQEDLIEELNKTVYQQQQKLDRLEAICEALARHIQSLAEEGNESKPANERPPHY
jgi:SlyX protein